MVAKLSKAHNEKRKIAKELFRFYLTIIEIKQKL